MEIVYGFLRFRRARESEKRETEKDCDPDYKNADLALTLSGHDPSLQPLKIHLTTADHFSSNSDFAKPDWRMMLCSVPRRTGS